MTTDAFYLPAETRRVRAWWLREARRHISLSRREHRNWHLRLARESRQYARNVVERFLVSRSGDAK